MGIAGAGSLGPWLSPRRGGRLANAGESGVTTHKERILRVLRGETVDRLPYVPRLDLWHLANSVAGTLPPEHAGRNQHEISRAEGWAIHHKYVYGAFGELPHDALLHRGIGIFRTRDTVVDFVLPRDVEVEVEHDGPVMRIAYHTPVGVVSHRLRYDESMQRLGISIPLHEDHLIKSVADYPAVWHLFEHMQVVPNHERFTRWAETEIGDDGVPVAAHFHGASPMQQIQRDLIDATAFYIHYKDHQRELRELAARMEPLFERILEICCASPAPVINWGSNFDDMLTYPPYFAREIQPWIRRASAALADAGKILMCHTDGENRGLMELIRDSGMHVAESICPAPMTQVSLAEYYQAWAGKLTLFGGVPSTLLLPETSEAAFDAYVDELFRAIAPGSRFVVGIADQVPPNAVFARLRRLGQRVAEEGRLPLEAGGFRPAMPASAPAAPPTATHAADDEERFYEVQDDVHAGDHLAIRQRVLALVEDGVPAQEILERGLIAAMDEIGQAFASGEAFIPEVLLSARAMNEAVDALGPYLASAAERHRGRILVGTVAGDVHDIGKNMVVTMLKGVGFEVQDLGVNVPRARFVAAVAESRPDILGLSALLTTTMMEMRQVIASLETAGLRDTCRVIVGGAPLSAGFADEIGADGFAEDAVSAVALAKQLVAERRSSPAA